MGYVLVCHRQLFHQIAETFQSVQIHQGNGRTRVLQLPAGAI